MAELTAWMADFGGDRRAATGVRTLVHLVSAPVLVAIPRAPSHCRRVLLWQDRMLPAWDVGAFLGAPPLASERAIAAIAVYRAASGKVEVGALLLAEPPVRATISEPEACALPDARWSPVAASCFKYRGRAFPVLDLRRMFESPPALHAHSPSDAEDATEDAIAAA